MFEEARIQVDPHTLERAEERGTNEAEVRDVLQTGVPIPGKHGREGKAKIYDFKRVRNGKYFEQKRVEMFYTIGGQTWVTATVCVFHGKWGS